MCAVSANVPERETFIEVEDMMTRLLLLYSCNTHQSKVSVLVPCGDGRLSIKKQPLTDTGEC